MPKIRSLFAPQPPHSPDLAPCDLFLFPKFKSVLQGRCLTPLMLKKNKFVTDIAGNFEKSFPELFDEGGMSLEKVR